VEPSEAAVDASDPIEGSTVIKAERNGLPGGAQLYDRYLKRCQSKVCDFDPALSSEK